MGRYSYHIFSDNDFLAEFSSINSALDALDIPFDKKIEIGKFYRQKPFESHHMKSYLDDKLGLKIEVHRLL